MAYLIFGFAALALGLFFMRAFARANPAIAARRLKVGGGVGPAAGCGRAGPARIGGRCRSTRHARVVDAVGLDVGAVGSRAREQDAGADLAHRHRSSGDGARSRYGRDARTRAQGAVPGQGHREPEPRRHGAAVAGLPQHRSAVCSAHRGLSRSHPPELARGHGARRIRYEPRPRRAHDGQGGLRDLGAQARRR